MLSFMLSGYIFLSYFPLKDYILGKSMLFIPIFFIGFKKSLNSYILIIFVPENLFKLMLFYDY